MTPLNSLLGLVRALLKIAVQDQLQQEWGVHLSFQKVNHDATGTKLAWVNHIAPSNLSCKPLFTSPPHLRQSMQQVHTHERNRALCNLVASATPVPMHAGTESQTTKKEKN
jgi:hypothetical protein